MATSNLTEPTSAANGNIPYIGADPGDGGDGNTLREAISRINARVREIYGAQDGSNVVQTPFVDNDNIKDNAVDHDELADRYTAKQEISTTSGSVSIDWGSYSTFEFTASLTGNIELDFTGFKQGQVIDIYGLTGSHTVTIDSDASTSETFHKVGGVDYDGTSNNLIQVVCTDDSADAVFHYSVATYSATDDTP